MYAEVSASIPTPISPTQNPKPQNNRRSAGYHPSIWGDHFLSYSSKNILEKEEKKKEHEKLKEEVKEKLMIAIDEPSKKLDLVDAIQRLGISYQFQKEIDHILGQIMQTMTYSECDAGINYNDGDLYSISLKFRLLRQHGYRISCGMFNKFKDSEGNFKESLINDVKGMLSLYEAAHLRVHGEDILDKALYFTTTRLGSIATNSNNPLASQVTHALYQPRHKGLSRLEARRFMPIYQADPSHDKVLLTFAKLDFNMLQTLHQKEVSDIAKWWKDLDFSRKLSFARDRLIECYFWILGVYFEPEYLLARRFTTKIIAMASVMDDIYDVYGTLDELELLTNAIQRWDINAKDQLPEYMQIYFQAFLDVYNEIEVKMEEEGKLYRVHYAKEAMKKLVGAYFQEARWFHGQHVPTLDEYMSVALVSSGYEMLAATCLVGMGDIVTNDSLDWSLSEPKIVTACEAIARLMDDIVSHKFEQKRGDVASCIECYMKQYGGTEEEAVEHFRKQVTKAWKDINEECLCPTAVPMPLLTRILNLARAIDVIYKSEDGYTNVGQMLKESVASVLINPVP